MATLRGVTVASRTWQIAAYVLQPPAFEQRVPGDAPPTIGTLTVETAGRTAHLRTDAAPRPPDVWWSFGDMSGAHGADVSHTYLRPGNQLVNLWVTDAAGTTA